MVAFLISGHISASQKLFGGEDMQNGRETQRGNSTDLNGSKEPPSVLPNIVFAAVAGLLILGMVANGLVHRHDGLGDFLTAFVPFGVVLACLVFMYWHFRSAGFGNDVQAADLGAAHGFGRPDEAVNSEAALNHTDPLTGLGNRKRLQEKHARIATTRIGGRQRLTLGLVNLDGMKPINDLFGSTGGDEILRQCAARLEAAVHEDGFICRLSGDEFGFLFPDVGDRNSAEEKGRLLQNVLLAPFDLNGHTVRLSGSFGFAVSKAENESFEDLITNAGTALYHSKRNGRSRVTVYSSEIEEMSRENARLEQALRNAVAEHQVEPYFQPIISLQDGSLLGFEALARWNDPEFGSVSPAKFIPLAEERGIIAALTESMLLRAAEIAANWPEELFLSFNLSSVQLVDPSTANNIIKIIDAAGLPPSRLEIEVTETAMMSDPETAAMVIDQLHQAGVCISMDDFGTGQSSLGRLRELQLDKVKIDRAFIAAIGEDKPAEHIVRAILEMCAGLELTVVAEGIEEIKQAESLKNYGCHAGQGYLFGKPQDARRTMSYIRDFLGRDESREEKLALRA